MFVSAFTSRTRTVIVGFTFSYFSSVFQKVFGLFMFEKSFYPLLSVTIPLLCFLTPLYGGRDRVNGVIDNQRVVTLRGSGLPAQARAESDQGRVDPAMSISFARVVLQPSA